MEATLLVVVLITLFIRWLVLSGKMSAMQQRIELLAADQTQPALTRRVYALEQAVQELRAIRPAEVAPAPPASTVVGSPAREREDAQPEPKPAVPEPVISQPVVPQPEPSRVWESIKLCSFCGRSLPEPPTICECRSVEVTPALGTEPEPGPVNISPMQQPLPAMPTFSQRVRESMQGEEWEAVVGGSWLNKLGVLVLVIGIALFLGYSFTQMAPGAARRLGSA